MRFLFRPERPFSFFRYYHLFQTVSLPLRRSSGWWAGVLVWLLLGLLLGQLPAFGAETIPSIPSMPSWPWWVWPLGLFAATMVLGVFAVLAGIGGAVLFVPLAAGLLPFVHIDFIRGAGLMAALAGALAAGPSLLRQNLACLPLALPIALVSSLFAIFGAKLGLGLPTQLVQVLLGVLIIAMFLLMLFVRPERARASGRADAIARYLGIKGTYHDPERGGAESWEPRRMALALVLFAGVGLIAGMFGLGAGWANVPVLTLVMGVPLKVAVGTSYFLLAITDTTAAWVYMHQGALLPLLVAPTIMGIMVGASLGSKLLLHVSSATIRKVVLVVLFLAGLRTLLRGLGL